jgi:hypothetical protein
MNKRQFLASAALGTVALPALARSNPPARPSGPALLTVTGAIGHTNRGPFDPALDQLMHRQKVQFDKACTFDYDSLLALPAHSIRPTLEYDNRVHQLHGPRLEDVIRAAKAPLDDRMGLLLRAVDGYAVLTRLQDVRHYAFIVATHLDGHPMPLGGLGPLWAVYDADRFPEMRAKSLSERFALCPWALYHIEVRTA